MKMLLAFAQFSANKLWCHLTTHTRTVFYNSCVEICRLLSSLQCVLSKRE